MSEVERCALALALDLGYVSDEREWDSEDELNEYDRKRATRMAEIVLDTANHRGAVEALEKIECAYARTMPSPRDALRDRVLEIIATYRLGGQ